MIHIPRRLIEEFLSKVSSSQVETAGLLVGIVKGERAYVKRMAIGENILQSYTRFEIDVKTIIRTIETLKGEEDIIGIIHSHPAPAYPSAIDKVGMKRWPIIWVIIDALRGVMRAWHFDREVKIILEE
jgi:proteasome lid subunit RPN8/RPN11